MADNKEPVTMEIINSEQYKRANIRFNGKPAEEIREELKKEGWFYSRNHNVWYPKNDAAENSLNFANHIKETYFPETGEARIITEASEKDELVSMLQNGSSLKDILSKLSDMYGEDAMHEAFDKAREETEELEAEAYDKIVSNIQKSWEEHDNGVGQARDEEESREMNEELAKVEENIYPDDVNAAKTKLGDIVREAFLKVPENDKETTPEERQKRYDKWYRSMVDEIIEEIKAGNAEVIKAVNDFDLNKENHTEGNKWYSAEEAFGRDVQYKLLPDLYQKVQDRIKAEYDEKKIPYVVMFSSESPVFPSENKVYTVKEFNELILQADKEFHNRKEYAEKKYGSADNYWDLENEGKLPEEDKGIQFGYDKTNFKFFNIPNPANPEDTFSYEPSRYDIGDGNGSVFDYVRSTCSHDEFIEALNRLETELYFPGVTDSQREFVEKTVKEQSETLKKNLKAKMEDLDKAQEEYKELHKKWLIESSDAERVDELLKNALAAIKTTYDTSMAEVFVKVLDEYPFASGDVAGSEFLKYTANEAKKMIVSELYLPSRDAQKAMNAEDYKSYNSVDWAKLRKIWEQFPANVNMTEYAEAMLQDKCNSKGIAVAEVNNPVTPPEKETDNKTVTSEVAELTEEDLAICKKVIPPSQYNFTLELTQGEEGEFFKNKLKEIADTYRRINVDEELVNEDGTHNVGFRYFLGSTEIFLSEIDSDGIGFGYNILNGDIQMSEWGSTALDEITSIPFIEMDYHVPACSTIEGMLYKEHPENFPEYAPKKTEKPYNFFINDAANLDLGIGAEIEPITDLTAEEAAVKYAELKDKGLNPYIGINIPGDFIFDDKEGQGAGVFTETNGKSSFYIGDNFVKELKKNDEHAKNVIAAYKELYEMADKYILGVEKPEFVFEKEKELNPTFTIGGISYTQTQIEEELREDIENIFRDLVPEPYLAGIRLYQNPEKNGKINILVQYGTDPMEGTWREDDLFNAIAEENILFNGMEVDVNPITPEKSGTIEEYLAHLERLGATSEAEAIENQAQMLEEAEEPKELNVYTFSPFGYEGAIVQVETDLRRGIPAYDIVGISDGTVKETRERIRYAFSNSGLEFPAERVLQSLSPADLKKDSPLDLSMALSILGKSQNYPIDEPVLALGELELSGGIRPVRGAVAAVNSARAYGITNVVCDPATAELLKDIHGIKILAVDNLKEANEKLHEKDAFHPTAPQLYKNDTVEFNEDYLDKETLDSLPMDGHFETIRAIEVAVAGKHNILATGAPGCGKTMLMQSLMPALTPKLTEEEVITPRRIASIAGLDSPNRDIHIPPFRMPHQTASIEGICGGGPNCRPGEISLAHNGTLFLDETAEFRSSVLQMLRVPLETQQITLSRAGRSTVYPANFQLAMATNPCPCGCYGSHDKICLDSAKSIDLYWKKFSDPLLDRVEIKTFVEKDEKDTRKMSIETMKAQIATAFEIQRKRGVYNSHMNPQQIEEYCKLDKEGQEYLDRESENLTVRGKNNLLKLSLTLANMDGREDIRLNDLKEARELSAPVFEKPKQFAYQPEEAKVVNISVNDEGYITEPVDDFLNLLVSVSPDRKDAYAFKPEEADRQIKFLNDEQKKWETKNTFKIESLPSDVHEETGGYKKDSVLNKYPYFSERSEKTYKPDLRGGARVGSGRKPTGSKTERMTICLSILQSKELKRRANNENLTVSKYLVKTLNLDKADIEEINKILEKAEKQKNASKLVPIESSLTLDDSNISRTQIEDAEKERKRITQPVLNGERTGMYKAFKDFEDKGVFDIQGSHVKLAKNGGLTPTGWKQLQAAMEIYRSKKFETFRYILIDRKTGEIADQLAITSHMPNFCNVSKPNDETLKQVISRAEEKDYLIAICHNHPSGNTTESSFDRDVTDSLDRSLRRNDGLNRFAGHIILDHDTFNLAVPSEKTPGKCHWKKLEPLNANEKDRFDASPVPDWAGTYVGGTSALKEVAKKINDTENWNDDFIPVVFTNADRSITGVQYYSKNFFENESDKIRNEFQFAAMEAGAIGAFPVITDALWNKIPAENRSDFEALMKAHVMNDAFTDVAIDKTTITEKYDIEAGKNYYSFYRDQSDRKVDVVSTWTPEVNPTLFPPEGVGQREDKDGFRVKTAMTVGPEESKEYETKKQRKQNHDVER